VDRGNTPKTQMPVTFAARLGTFGAMVYPVRAYLYSRFSTSEQRKGNSLARQIEFTHRFCLKKGIGLDETLTFTDAGVSGHKGKNHQTGALGLFLQACEQGRIAAAAT
jgi:DNA invertase Pin-like site-specific DNA recombinase